MSRGMKIGIGIAIIVVVIVILYVVFGRNDSSVPDPLAGVLGSSGISANAIADAKGFKANFPNAWKDNEAQTAWDGFAAAVTADLCGGDGGNSANDPCYKEKYEQVMGFLKGFDIALHGWAVTQLKPHIEYYINNGGKKYTVIAKGAYLK